MPETNTVKTGDMEKAVMERIQAANSVLILMKKEPSVDEMATAIGLEMVLDEMGKRATVLYNGEIPGEIRFLEPEKSFAKNTEVLQDFVISFKQMMADHLRYDIVGDEVKVYISPYRQKITESDLKFSYGDAAVDLVIELNIRGMTELDRTGIEKILNQAETVEIATDELERTGQNTWVNKKASSVAEMIAGLIEKMPEAKIRREAANALLAGILMATEKFMNQKTTSETMGVAQKLMQAGASQAELIKEIEKGIAEAKAEKMEKTKKTEDATKTNTEEKMESTTETNNGGAPVEVEAVNAEALTETEATAATEVSTTDAGIPDGGVAESAETQTPVGVGVGTGVLAGAEAAATGVAGEVATEMAGAGVAGVGAVAGADTVKDDVVAKVDAAAAQAVAEMAKSGEKKVKIPEEKIGEIEQIAEKMRAEKAQKEVEAKLDEMMAPKAAPIEEYQAEEVLGDGTAKAVERVRTAGVYPGAEVEDFVSVQPKEWQTKDYAAMMEKELEESAGDENPAATAANAFGAGDAGANMPEMDYTATEGVENAPGFDPSAVAGVEGGGNGGAASGADIPGVHGETSEVPEMKPEPMRKIERPEAVVQTMTEDQLKQPWEIGMNAAGTGSMEMNAEGGVGVNGDTSVNAGTNGDFSANSGVNGDSGTSDFNVSAGKNGGFEIPGNEVNAVPEANSEANKGNAAGDFSVPIPNNGNGGVGELSPVDGLPMPGGMNTAGGTMESPQMPEVTNESTVNENGGGNAGSGDVGAFHIPGM